MSIIKFRNFLEGNKIVVIYFLLFIIVSGCTKSPGTTTIEVTKSPSFANKVARFEHNADVKQRFVNLHNSIVSDINNKVLNKDIEVSQENLDDYLLAKNLPSIQIGHLKTLYGEIMPYLRAVKDNKDPIAYFKDFMVRKNVSQNMSNYLINSIESQNFSLNLNEISTLDVSLKEKQSLILMNMIATSYLNGELKSAKLIDKDNSLQPRGGALIVLMLVGAYLVVIAVLDIVDGMFGDGSTFDSLELLGLLGMGVVFVIAGVNEVVNIFSKGGGTGSSGGKEK
jgi:hypothetical protein